MSERGLELLTEWEGSEPQLYHDVAGLPTIGVGHLLTRDELSSGKIHIIGEDVKYRDGLTEDQIDRLLAQDLRPTEGTVTNNVLVDLLQHQFDALVSFVFNVGRSAFMASTLLRKLNAGIFEEVPVQMRRWVYAGGRRVQGLVNRREKEVRLWENL